MRAAMPINDAGITFDDRDTWLITGVAGFIGSNILQYLLSRGCRVRGLDNLATGRRANLEDVARLVGGEAWSRFDFVQGDIRDRDQCLAAVEGMTIVLHQAALGSVPRSIADPMTSHAVNGTGFVNMLDASRLAGVRRFVYAASSSTYGDEPHLPKVEARVGRPLSPYAATKAANESYAFAFDKAYGLESVGLRYFNVFGPRQDPDGAYAAVIPKWVRAMLAGDRVTINGDGATSRDFCFVANAVQANIRAAMAPRAATCAVYNVAVGAQTTLRELLESLRSGLAELGISYDRAPDHHDERRGDVRHSLADISRARAALGYEPSHSIAAGLREALPWYVEHYHEATGK
jgi:UDP-N-acetylglucosamine/UDP-N-acetylgalactosamine 4-epimerase